MPCHTLRPGRTARARALLSAKPFRPAALSFAAVLAIVMLAAPAAAKPSDPLKCQLAILKATATFVKAKTKALQKCEETRLKGKHDDTCPDDSAAKGSPAKKAADQIAKAAGKLGAAIAKKCGGDDKTCGTADDAQNPFTPATIGFGQCFCPPGVCTTAIDDCDDVATCVEDVGMDAVEEIVALIYDGLEDSDPKTQKPLNKCQRAIGKETLKYALAKEKALGKCWQQRYKGKHDARCPDPTADPKAAKPAVKAAQQIAKAESKKIQKICKACGGPDKKCDDAVATVNPGLPASIPGSGGDDDLDPATIGTLAECPSVRVPAKPGRASRACARPITTLADLVFCLDCVAEYYVDCFDPVRVPALEAYPDPECPVGVCPETDLGSTLPVSQGGSNVGAPSDFVSPSCGGTGPERFFRWTAPSTGRVKFSTVDAGTSYDTVLSLRAGNCTGAELTCNDDSSGTLQSTVALLPAQAGQTVAILVDGFGGATGNFVLDIEALPAAGACCTVNAGNPGCNQGPCQNCVCGANPNCCNVEWSQACADRAADQCGAFCLGCAAQGSCGGALLCANGTCHCPQTCLGYLSGTTCVGAPSNVCDPPLDDSGIACTP